MDARDIIVHALTTSQTMLDRFIDDLGPKEWLCRAAPKANCAAWTLGHLILTERRALDRLGVKEMPPLPEGFEKRFARDDAAPAAAEYGDTSILRPLWTEHRRLLIDAVRHAPTDLFDQPLEKPHPMFKNMGQMLDFIALHCIMHAGQISTIRRSLGRPPVV